MDKKRNDKFSPGVGLKFRLGSTGAWEVMHAAAHLTAMPPQTACRVYRTINGRKRMTDEGTVPAGKIAAVVADETWGGSQFRDGATEIEITAEIWAERKSDMRRFLAAVRMVPPGGTAYAETNENHPDPEVAEIIRAVRASTNLNGNGGVK